MKRCVYAAYSKEDADYFLNEIKNLWDVTLIFDSSKIIEILKNDNFDFVILDAEAGGFFLRDISALIKKEFPDIHIFIIIHCNKNEWNYDLFGNDISSIFEFPCDLKTIYNTIENFFLDSCCHDRIADYTIEKEFADILKNEVIGVSNSVNELRNFIYKASQSKLPVLLLGETGSGKGLAADLIHKLSPIKNKKFLSINVSCIPEELAESFLFGTEEGSFTGAIKKEGVFSEAKGGTIFLDEMETLSMDVQAKLLHVLESGFVRSVGAVTEKKVDFRLIASSNEDLKQMIQEKKFRQDLYYRLDVLRHEIPPLRNRKEDIKYLVYAYLSKINKNIDDEAIAKLRLYNWPGNIRELYNCLNRAGMLAGQEQRIEAQHIQF
ncbi:sigma 54-interacting transcriptional regulator [Treponema putidum]|uniref:Sigma-54-dependent Fis family transcriptional regulator n=1 Tax=Treponema putidum TaxID=221027 RepID=A0ABY5HWJ2_9SPIR|nr:sigma 54-interacting transcriptional regulator [Treponema putidum]AIN93562.1 ATPase AAA [Treponema putidum]TWI75439.1 two-component system response regulator AtoC [Treponema putidum]UTY29813.1 sigma-54-dependent Fis family transcriptional regulator [Treponema putidum]